MLSMILHFLFTFSSNYIRLSSLLSANKAQKENLIPPTDTLGIGFNHIRFTLLFIVVYHLILTPIAYATHDFFKYQDCHVAILIAVIYVLMFFILFAITKQSITRMVVKYQIQKLWSGYFAYFSYNDYSDSINDIYNESIKEHISKDKLERYVFDKIAKQN